MTYECSLGLTIQTTDSKQFNSIKQYIALRMRNKTDVWFTSVFWTESLKSKDK